LPFISDVNFLVYAMCKFCSFKLNDANFNKGINDGVPADGRVMHLPYNF